MNLLNLQNVARHNHLGSIWSGTRKDIVLGAQQPDYLSCDESIRGFNDFNRAQAEETGYPMKLDSPSLGHPIIRLQPWHERKCKLQLEMATRSQFREHKSQEMTLPYGFVLDMQAAM